MININPDKVLQMLLDLKPIVVEAGKKYIEPRFSGEAFEVDFEANPDDPVNYVTVADRHMSDILLESLRRVLPGSYSEEDMRDRSFRGPIAVVDPIDGTGGYVDNLYESCGTLVAILDENNQPVGGLAYAPETRRLTLATLWEGPFFEEGGAQKPTTLPANSVIAVQRTEAYNPKLDKFLEWFGGKRRLSVETVEGGGPGSFAAVNGAYDYTFFTGTVGCGNWKEWDTAALQVILERSGWTVTDLRGHRLPYNQFHPNYYNGVLATKLNHLGISHKDVAEDIAEFTERYGDDLKLPQHKETDGTLLVTPKIYNEWQQSVRRAQLKKDTKGIQTKNRIQFLLRRKLFTQD